MPAADRRFVTSKQAQRLRQLVEGWVQPFSAFYRERLAAGALPDGDDLERLLDALPLTRKQTILRGDPLDLVLRPTPHDLRASLRIGRKLRAALLPGGRSRLAEEIGWEFRPVLSFFTTGRSSAPLGFHLTRYDLDLLAQRGRWMLQVLGAGGEGTRGLSLFPYAPHLAFWQTYHGGVAGGLLILHTGGGRSMGTAGILAALLRMRPSLLLGIPGYTYHLLRKAYDDGTDVSCLRHVVLGGEAVGQGFRRRMLELLRELGAQQAEVRSVYGLTEVRNCFPECAGGEETGFHLHDDHVVCEIVDPRTERRVPEGVGGEIVLTPLEGRGSMILRYATGDVAERGVVRGHCPACGHVGARILGPIRRRSDMLDLRLDKVKGTLVDFGLVGELLSGVREIDEWHLTIGKRDNDPYETDVLRLEVALRNGDSAEGVEEKVRDLLRQQTELSLDSFAVLSRAELLDRVGMEDLLKERRITDMRPTRGEPGSLPGSAPGSASG